MSSIANGNYIRYDGGIASRHAPDCGSMGLGLLGCSCSPRTTALGLAFASSTADLLDAKAACAPSRQPTPALEGLEKWIEFMPMPNAPKLESTPTFEPLFPPVFVPIPSPHQGFHTAPLAPESTDPERPFEYMPVPNAPKLEATSTFPEPLLPPVWSPISPPQQDLDPAPPAPASTDLERLFECMPVPSAPKLEATPTFPEPLLAPVWSPTSPPQQDLDAAPLAPASADPERPFEYVPVPNAPKLEATPTFPELLLPPVWSPISPPQQDFCTAPSAPAVTDPRRSFDYIPSAPRLAATPTFLPFLPASDHLLLTPPTPSSPQSQLVASPPTRPAYTHHHTQKSIRSPPSPFDISAAAISSLVGRIRSARRTKTRTSPRASPAEQPELVVNLDARLAPFPVCALGLYQQPLGHQTAVVSF